MLVLAIFYWPYYWPSGQGRRHRKSVTPWESDHKKATQHTKLDIPTFRPDEKSTKPRKKPHRLLKYKKIYMHF